MEVHILKENLNKGVGAALKFTSAKVQMPILSYILIEAGDSGIFLSATNLEMGVRLRVAGKVVKPGSVIVPARVLSDLVQHLPLGGVKLILSGDSLQVLAGGVRAKIQSGKVADFPPFLEKKEKTGEIEVVKLKNVFERVGFAISTDESRPVLTGFLWSIDDSRLVATDGYRLSIVDKIEAWKTAKKVGQLLVPGKAMMQVIQHLDDFGIKTCDFEYNQEVQQLLFFAEDLLVVVRLLTGDYPQYEAILPKDSTIEVEVLREDLLEAVKAAAIFARDGANIIKLIIEEGKVRVSANAAQVGENVVEIEARERKSGKVLVAFNSRYLVDFLTHSETELVQLGFTDPLRPGLFSEKGNVDYRHVIMPVRVREAV